jgi:S-adenosylmethionine synthetase
MGRTPEKKEVTFRDGSGKSKSIAVETFTWEKLDMVDAVRKAFKIK